MSFSHLVELSQAAISLARFLNYNPGLAEYLKFPSPYSRQKGARISFAKYAVFAPMYAFIFKAYNHAGITPKALDLLLFLCA